MDKKKSGSETSWFLLAGILLILGVYFLVLGEGQLSIMSSVHPYDISEDKAMFTYLGVLLLLLGSWMILSEKKIILIWINLIIKKIKAINWDFWAAIFFFGGGCFLGLAGIISLIFPGIVPSHFGISFTIIAMAFFYIAEATKFLEAFNKKK